MPGFVERCRQLTAARAENPWLATGSVIVQQQAIRDHGQAMANFFNGTHHRPSWRKADRHEGFRIVAVKPGDIRRLNRRQGEVKIPKAGWVRFRWSRAVPDGVKSYRVTRDPAGRWHIAFAVVPKPLPAPRTGAVVGVDRGVAVSAALSTGELLCAPSPPARERGRLHRLERKLARARRGSNRRRRVRAAIAKIKARDKDRRKDWVEKASTDIARRFDVIRVEDLNIKGMTRSAKGTADIPGRNVRQKAACNADVNAARNIAAGHAVKARGGDDTSRPVNREPQLLASLREWVESSALQSGRMSIRPLPASYGPSSSGPLRSSGRRGDGSP